MVTRTQKEKQMHPSPIYHLHLQDATTVSTLTGCIATCCGSCSTLDRKALWRAVGTARPISRTELASTEDLDAQRCRKRANRDPNQPNHKLFRLLLSGTLCCSIWSCTSRLGDSFILQATRLLNSGAHYCHFTAVHLQSLCLYTAPTYRACLSIYSCRVNVIVDCDAGQLLHIKTY